MTDVTETILREIQRQLRAALENAQRDRELAHRAVARVDRFDERLDMVAADIRIIRSDVASIDIKLSALANIEAKMRELSTEP